MTANQNIAFFSDVHPSRITNLAADRANLHRIRAENVYIGTSVELPDGSLQIDTRGAGTSLTALPEAGALDGNAFQLRTLTAGANVTFNTTNDNITINSAGGGGGGGITSINSGPGDESLVAVGSAPVATLKAVTAGAGIQLASDANEVTFTNSATIADGGVAGQASVVQAGTAPNYLLRRIAAGSGITVAQGADVVTITNAIDSITTIISKAGDESLVAAGTAPLACIKAVTAGAGIQLASDADEVTFTNSATIADGGVAGQASVVQAGTAPNYLLRRIAAGTGITVAQGADVVTITNAAAGTTPSLTALAGDQELVPASPQTTFNFTMKSLTAGAGISLASDANAVTITNSGAAQAYTLAPDVAATGQSLVATPSPTANDFRLRNILAGAGMLVTTVGEDVVVTFGGAATAVTLADSAGGHVSWVVNGTGPNLTIKGMNSGLGRIVRPYFNLSSVWVDNIAMRMVGSDGAATPQTGADAATASAAGALAFGVGANALGSNSVAVGQASNANTTACVALGPSANAGGNRCIAIGPSASASAGNAVAVGRVATASGTNSIAIGHNTNATSTEAVALGFQAVASGVAALAYGAGAMATLANSVACGPGAVAQGTSSTAIGYQAQCTTENGTAFGAGAQALSNSTALGQGCIASGSGSLAVGLSSTVSGTRGVAVGFMANSTAADGIAVGLSASATAQDTVSIGRSSLASAPFSVAVGNLAQATGLRSLAFGHRMRCNADRSIVVGSSDNNLSDLSFGIPDSFCVATNSGGVNNLRFSVALGACRMVRPSWLADLINISATGVYQMTGNHMHGGIIRVNPVGGLGDVNIRLPSDMVVALTAINPFVVTQGGGGSFTIVNQANNGTINLDCNPSGAWAVRWYGNTSVNMTLATPVRILDRRVMEVRWWIEGGQISLTGQVGTIGTT